MSELMTPEAARIARSMPDQRRLFVNHLIDSIIIPREMDPLKDANYFKGLNEQFERYFGDLNATVTAEIGHIGTLVAPGGGAYLYAVLMDSVDGLINLDRSSMFVHENVKYGGVRTLKAEGMILDDFFATTNRRTAHFLSRSPSENTEGYLPEQVARALGFYIRQEVIIPGGRGGIYRYGSSEKQFRRVIDGGYDTFTKGEGEDIFPDILASFLAMGIPLADVQMRAYNDGYEFSFYVNGHAKKVYYYSDELPMPLTNIPEGERRRSAQDVRRSILFRHQNLAHQNKGLFIHGDLYGVGRSTRDLTYMVIFADFFASIPEDLREKFEWKQFPSNPESYRPMRNMGHPENILDPRPTMWIGYPKQEATE